VITFYRIFDIVLFSSIYRYFSPNASFNLRSFTDHSFTQNPTCGLREIGSNRPRYTCMLWVYTYVHTRTCPPILVDVCINDPFFDLPESRQIF